MSAAWLALERLLVADLGRLLTVSERPLLPGLPCAARRRRALAVEYKGGDRISNADSREKRDIGGVWALSSGGRCVFAMVSDATTMGASMEAQLRAAIG